MGANVVERPQTDADTRRVLERGRAAAAYYYLSAPPSEEGAGPLRHAYSLSRTRSTRSIEHRCRRRGGGGRWWRGERGRLWTRVFAQNVIAIAGSVKTANVNLQPY